MSSWVVSSGAFPSIVTLHGPVSYWWFLCCPGRTFNGKLVSSGFVFSLKTREEPLPGAGSGLGAGRYLLPEPHSVRRLCTARRLCPHGRSRCSQAGTQGASCRRCCAASGTKQTVCTGCPCSLGGPGALPPSPVRAPSRGPESITLSEIRQRGKVTYRMTSLTCGR